MALIKIKNKIKNILVLFRPLRHSEKGFVPVAIIAVIGLISTCVSSTLSFSLIDDAVKIGLGVFASIFLLILAIFQVITALFPVITGAALSTVITSEVPLTSGGIVDAGVELTRNFANLFFIVFLVAIAIATILRLERYGMKKALPMLILAALLINFSSVICGVVLDAAQVVMNFFIIDAWDNTNIGLSLLEMNVMEAIHFDNINDIFENFTTLTLHQFIGRAVSIVFRGIIAICFNVIVFLILGVYTIVFLLRIVIIWILVILAPLAWLGLAFPAIRSWWSTWWKHFFQWSIIGIVLLFFLWLSLNLLVLRPGDIFESCAGIGGESCPLVPEDFFSGERTEDDWEEFGRMLICSILPFITIIALLIIGLLTAGKSGDVGAGHALKATKWTGRKIGGAAGGVAKEKAAGWAMKKGSLAQKIIRGIETTPLVGKWVGGPGAISARLRPPEAEEKKMMRQLKPRTTADLRTRLKQIEKFPRGRKNLVEMSTILKEIAGRKEFEDQDTLHLPLLGSRGFSTKDFYKARPDLAGAEKLTKEKIQKRIDKKEIIGESDDISAVIQKMSPEVFQKNAQSEALKKWETFIRMDIPKLKRMGGQGDAEQIKAIVEAGKEAHRRFSTLTADQQKTVKSLLDEMSKHPETWA